MVVVVFCLQRSNMGYRILNSANIIKKFLHFHPKYNKFVTVNNLGNYGRLGNQLFQYAAVRSYSLKHDVPLLLPKPTEHRLGNFQISCQYVNRNTLQVVNRVQFEEKQFHFDPDFFQYYNRKDFTGYFQTEKYFVDIRDTLLEEFSLRDTNKTDYCLRYIENIRSENPGKSIVALHNRRGDNIPSKEKYSAKISGVFHPDKEIYHPLLSVDYFHKAKSFFNDSAFLVFSDNEKDIQWCKENINGPHHYYSERHDDLTDFTLMRYCDHNIISNSSFSWWAAWLNENPDQVVIAPQKWFGDYYKEWDIRDIYLGNWTII